MTIAKGLTRTAYRFGASSLALLLIGCTEQGATAPDKAVLDISRRPAFTATIATHVTIYGKGGTTQQYDHSQEVEATFKDGIAHATPLGRLKSLAAPGGVTSDGVVIAPVLALVGGAEAYNYDETTVDSVGNVIRLVATGPANGGPVTDSYAYMNGVLTAYNHSTWLTASGGYVLSTQTLRGYSAGGTPVAEITSIITPAPAPRTITSRDIGAKFAAFSRTTFDRVACALAPNSAYASAPRCLRSGLAFAGETIVLGTATVLVPEATAALAIWGGGYVVGWGLWTNGLHEFLSCIDSGGGGKLRLGVKTQ